jgi:hypothetical protein
VTFEEDRSQVRWGTIPHRMAACRNTAMGLWRWAGHTNIAAACRRLAAQPAQALALIGIECENCMALLGCCAPLTAASGCSCGPAGRTRCMLGGSHARAIAIVHGPVELAHGRGLLRHGLTETLPETRCAPALTTVGHRAPRPRAFRPIAPRGTGAQHPHDAVEEVSMSQSGATRGRFLRWKQRLEPLPLRVGEFFAFHTGACPPPARVCQHALVLAAQCHVLAAGS